MLRTLLTFGLPALLPIMGLADGHTVIETPSGAPMVALPGGWFTMGSDDGSEDEAPAHQVYVDGFLIDQYEVTQELYGLFVVANPSRFKGVDLPVEQVSWAAAALFCNLRSRAEGLTPCYDEDTAECNFAADGYRLPTEAEWEYACRAGTDTSYAFGDDPADLGTHAWYADNAEDATHPVGSKAPNDWGLYDMHGNVAEWCNDAYDPDYYGASSDHNPVGPATAAMYVLRGGSFGSTADECRSSHRLGDDPGFQDPCFRGEDLGFRCVRRLPEAAAPD